MTPDSAVSPSQYSSTVSAKQEPKAAVASHDTPPARIPAFLVSALVAGGFSREWT